MTAAHPGTQAGSGARHASADDPRVMLERDAGAFEPIPPYPPRTEREAEYDLTEFSERVTVMPSLIGEARADESQYGVTKGSVIDLFAHQVREGGLDGVTRFQALSRIIGYWIRRFRDGHVTREQAWEEIVGRCQDAGHRSDVHDRAAAASADHRSGRSGQHTHETEHVDLEYSARVFEWVALYRDELALQARAVDDT